MFLVNVTETFEDKFLEIFGRFPDNFQRSSRVVRHFEKMSLDEIGNKMFPANFYQKRLGIPRNFFKLFINRILSPDF